MCIRDRLRSIVQVALRLRGDERGLLHLPRAHPLRPDAHRSDAQGECRLDLLPCAPRAKHHARLIPFQPTDTRGVGADREANIVKPFCLSMEKPCCKSYSEGCCMQSRAACPCDTEVGSPRAMEARMANAPLSRPRGSLAGGRCGRGDVGRSCPVCRAQLQHLMP